MDLSRKWPYPNIREKLPIQGQHKIHYHKTMDNTTILGWECGFCEKTNEDLSRRHCIICGTPEPPRYYVIGPAIEPGIGQRWFGKLAGPIDDKDNKADTTDLSSAHLCNTDSVRVGESGINNIMNTNRTGEGITSDEKACRGVDVQGNKEGITESNRINGCSNNMDQLMASTEGKKNLRTFFESRGLVKSQHN
jgi:hypothetical protein